MTAKSIYSIAGSYRIHLSKELGQWVLRKDGLAVLLPLSIPEERLKHFLRNFYWYAIPEVEREGIIQRVAGFIDHCLEYNKFVRIYFLRKEDGEALLETVLESKNYRREEVSLKLFDLKWKTEEQTQFVVGYLLDYIMGKLNAKR